MPDDFDLLNNFVHDLKNPLASAKSYVELIEHSGELNERQKHFSDKALVGLERIQQIVNELLDFARMESDQVLHMSRCDLREITERAVSLLENMSRENQVTVKVDISDDVREFYGDGRLMTHVMSNLVSNGIKYNQSGGSVYVTVESAGEYIEVTVEDTGIGMPPDVLEDIFERFYRVERKDRRRIEGTGLGLAIVKSVIERHGGTIHVETELGVGSAFIFTLPRTASQKPDLGREVMDDVDDRHQERRESREDSDSGIF